MKLEGKLKKKKIWCTDEFGINFCKTLKIFFIKLFYEKVVGVFVFMVKMKQFRF